MEYFVSAEDTMYHRWQLELLIESFKMHGISDKLVVGLAKNNQTKTNQYCCNLLKCPKIFYHDNLGAKGHYKPLNRPHALLIALKNKFIQQPFVLIEPDMVLFSPIASIEEDLKIQMNPLLSLKLADQHCKVKEIIKSILSVKKMKENSELWIPVGSIMVCNNLPTEFFQRVIEWLEILKNNNSLPWFAEKVAWALTIIEYYGHITCGGTYDYEMSLIDNKENNFIHYQHGMPPVFNKRMYKLRPPDYLSMGDPLEALLESNPSTSSDYMQKVVKKYIKNIPKKQMKLKDCKIGKVTVRKAIDKDK